MCGGQSHTTVFPEKPSFCWNPSSEAQPPGPQQSLAGPLAPPAFPSRQVRAPVLEICLPCYCCPQRPHGVTGPLPLQHEVLLLGFAGLLRGVEALGGGGHVRVLVPNLAPTSGLGEELGLETVKCFMILNCPQENVSDSLFNLCV